MVMARSSPGTGPVDFGRFVTVDGLMRPIIERVRKLARSELSVLLVGETGTGKEELARAIHAGSGRRDGPFIPINAGGLGFELAESQLMGHVKGSFTGADRDRAGLLEHAEGGTAFLDEIGDMPSDAQVLLLRVLSERGELRAVGSNVVKRVDVRIVAATNRTVDDLIREGRFRRDLYHRLEPTIRIPPLRERPSDVEFLVRRELARTAPGLELTERALKALLRYDWPGNVRQLKTAILYASIMATRGTVDVGDLPEAIAEGGVVSEQRDARSLRGPRETLRGYLRRVEQEEIEEALVACEWNVAEAARALGLARSTLGDRLLRLGLIQKVHATTIQRAAEGR